MHLDSWWYTYGDKEHWKGSWLCLRGKIQSLVLDIWSLTYLLAIQISGVIDKAVEYIRKV